MSGSACIGDPISWLRLERRRLGELPERERQAIDAHLDACVACATCAAETQVSLTLRPLPGPVMNAGATAGERPRLRARLRRWLMGARVAGAWAPLAAVGVAATLLWIARATPGPTPGSTTPDEVPTPIESMQGIKGGDVSLSLVRERQGVVDHDALTFTGDDRWKVLVTCPSPRVLFWDVAVDDGRTITFPLAAGAPIACGNRVPLPGAFRLSAQAATSVQICLWLADGPLDRSQLLTHAPERALAHRADHPPAPARDAICTPLRPESHRP